jgi:hypothetical protein
MPLQNRVNPWGEIVATPERGLFMGNRGCLHDGQRRVTKAWARTPWVTCALKFKDRHRTVMSPGQYTELFFLDEATALAAGHRPCATCRRADYDAFKALWLEANPELAARSEGKTTEIDKLLHAERVDAQRNKRTWSARLGDLPDGCMVVLPARAIRGWSGAVRCMPGCRGLHVSEATGAGYRSGGAHATLGGEDPRPRLSAGGASERGGAFGVS